ncbi:tetratricopeptide repeat protein [Thermoproteota archaeon]
MADLDLLTTVSWVFGIILSSGILFWIFQKIVEQRWKKYRCRKLNTNVLFSEYYEKKFLNEVESVKHANKKLDDWFNKKSGTPLLVLGKSGIGKTRIITQYLYNLSWFQRLYVRIFIPGENLLKKTPYLTYASILFLDDFHSFRQFFDDDALKRIIQNKKWKVIATIPDEKYDENWDLLSSIHWTSLRVKTWTEKEGEQLAKIFEKDFKPKEFQGTPMSVIHSKEQIWREYARSEEKEKNIIKNLAYVKHFLNTMADIHLMQALTNEEINNYEFIQFNKKFDWISGSKDGLFINESAYFNLITNEQINLTFNFGVFYDLLVTNSHLIPDIDKYYTYLGNWCIIQNKIDDALGLFNIALQKNQNRVEAWYSKGNILEKIGKSNEALECFDKILSIDENYSEAWIKKSAILGFRKKWDEKLARNNCEKHDLLCATIKTRTVNKLKKKLRVF